GIPTAIAQGSWLGETALLTQDGQEIPVSQLILAHKSSAGSIEYISTTMRDLTQQKQAEQSLKQRAIELEWLNKELVKITSLLKKRNQELDNFAYVTSHDLKAPLRAIANLASWLSEDLEGQIPEENQQQLQLMQSRVQRMDGLIQGLLEYSRVGRRETPVKTVNVGDLVNEAIDSLSPPPEFEIVVAPNMPTLTTKPVLLQQVFFNLISNAIKYHPQNSGKIIISVAEQDNFYEFGVSDDGLGIAPQYHDRIFTIFQTLQPRDTIESTGIGLSIVKKIVEGQGGKVRVESKLGEGASFYFTWQKQ
ncbi:MAG: ATP-binding protein, partial [Waterburya sp.]